MNQADARPRLRDPLIGLRIDRRYVVRSVLGRGGMGVVYEGVHLELGRPVAIKVLSPAWRSDPDAVERFLREARTASSLSHGNIVDVSDLGRLPDGRPYLVMPKIEGKDLAVVMSESGPLPAKRVAELLGGVASALDLIHAKGYVHRDIKPENLMYVVREDGSETVMLLDFGIAALVISNEQRLTQQGAVFGTPQYLPPEVCGGVLPDGRGDVYALATVAFELITGRLPFQAASPAQLLPMKVAMQPSSLSSVTGKAFPPELEAVLARGLARSPDDRFATASDFIDALEISTARAPMSWRPGVLRPVVSSGEHRLEQAAVPRIAHEAPAQGSEPFVRPASVSHKVERVLATSAKPLSLQTPQRAAEAMVSFRPRPRLGYGTVVGAAAALLLLGLWLLPRNAPTPSLQPMTSGPTPTPLSSTALVTGAQNKLGSPAMQPTAQIRAAFPASPKQTPAARSAGTADGVARRSTAEVDAPRLRGPETEAPPAPYEAPEEPTSSSDQSVAASAPTPQPNPIETQAPTPQPDAIEPKAPPASPPPPDHELAARLKQEGTSALLRGESERAADLLRRATETNPTDAAAFRGLGLALERVGRPQEALLAYRRYLQLQPHGRQAELVRERISALHD
jgi:serine/threonine protein kinase